MSNIYIQEPPTVGKVLFITTVGDIDIELWSRECPKACRNFVQRCLEGYYNKTIFHRIEKGFIAQGGDPTGTGCGGESIYGEPFRDEFHSRLRFSRRGLVAMANGGRDDNGSQFFFTFAPCPELQNKNTIFGKVAGDTLFNMLKLEESQVDKNHRPLYPPQIIKARVLNNPFSDMFPRKHLKPKPIKEEEEDVRKGGTKNFKLLSFGEEAEEDEAAVEVITKKYSGKSKSSHDLSNDPNLSSTPAVHEGKGAASVELAGDMAEEAVTEENCLQKVKDKLRARSKIDDKDKKKKTEEVSKVQSEIIEADEEIILSEKDIQLNKLKEEFKKLKKDYKDSLKVKEPTPEGSEESEISDTDNEILKTYKEELHKYRKFKKKQISKGAEREYKTLELLERFQTKIEKIRTEVEVEDEADNIDFDEDVDIPAESLFNHKLTFQTSEPVLAKDANTKDDNWYEIYDPRNPINKRRREEDAIKPKKKREEVPVDS